MIMTNMKMASRTTITVVVLGDSKVGKSSLVHKFVTGSFKEHYSPTSFDKSFASLEVQQHHVDFILWDTSGSPAYDSVRSLSYHEASVFLLCYKIADPISLYNVKNKWLTEIRKHQPHTPVVLCGLAADLRADPATLAHLGKTGRTPVTRDQALAICCEIDAVHYAETSARRPDHDQHVHEAFELCALAALKYRNECNNNNNHNVTFKRSPSIHSSVSLFETTTNGVKASGSGGFKRSPSTHSNLSLTSNFKLPPSSLALKKGSALSVTSLKSPEPMEVKLRTFSPEPSSVAPRIPPVISEDDAYQQPQAHSATLQSVSPRNKRFHQARPTSLYEPLTEAKASIRPQRPTTLFNSRLECQRNATFFSPTEPRAFLTPTSGPCSGGGQRRFDSLSELGTPLSASSSSFIKSPQLDVVWPNNAQVRPNGLSRRTSYRTHPKMAIPVATPMSPVSPELGFEPPSHSALRSHCQSPANSIQTSSVQELSSISEDVPVSSAASSDIIPVFPKIYESLKSNCSSSASSSEASSKLTSDLSEAGSVSFKVKHLKPQSALIEDEMDSINLNSDILDNFVSPKSGVFRPNAGRNRAKHNCSIM